MLEETRDTAGSENLGYSKDFEPMNNARHPSAPGVIQERVMRVELTTFTLAT